MQGKEKVLGVYALYSNALFSNVLYSNVGLRENKLGPVRILR